MSKTQLKRIEINQDDLQICEDQDYIIKGSVLMELNSRFAEFYEHVENLQKLLDNPTETFDLIKTAYRLKK